MCARRRSRRCARGHCVGMHACKHANTCTRALVSPLPSLRTCLRARARAHTFPSRRNHRMHCVRPLRVRVCVFPCPRSSPSAHLLREPTRRPRTLRALPSRCVKQRPTSPRRRRSSPSGDSAAAVIGMGCRRAAGGRLCQRALALSRRTWDVRAMASCCCVRECATFVWSFFKSYSWDVACTCACRERESMGAQGMAPVWSFVVWLSCAICRT